jgi:Leucine-rich repeat (LRR) protein
MLSICSTLVPAYTDLRDVIKVLSDALARYETFGLEEDRQVCIQALAVTEQAFADLEGKLMFANQLVRSDKVPVALGDLLATEFLYFSFEQRKIPLGHCHCYSEDGRVTKIYFRNLHLGNTFDYSPITHLSALKELSMGINEFQSLPDGLPESLICLKAEYNAITELSNFPIGIQTLNFANNLIEDLPACFKDPAFIKHLVYVNFQFNPLSDTAKDVLRAVKRANPRADVTFSDY